MGDPLCSKSLDDRRHRSQSVNVWLHVLSLKAWGARLNEPVELLFGDPGGCADLFIEPDMSKPGQDLGVPANRKQQPEQTCVTFRIIVAGMPSFPEPGPVRRLA